MKHILCILVLLSVKGFGQDEDSLLRQISLLENDTEKVNRLYERGFSLRNSDPGYAWKYSERCSSIAASAGSLRHVAKSHNLLGILWYKKGDLKKALQSHHKAHSIRQQLGDYGGMAQSNVNLGNIYTDLGWYSKAEQSYLSALGFFSRTGNDKQTGNCLVNLGVLNHTLKRPSIAREYYSQAIELSWRMNDYELRCICLNNLAQIYYDMGDHQRSIAMNYDALKLREIMENRVEAADSYLNLASNYLCLNEHTRAKSLIDTASQIASAFGYAEAVILAEKLYSEYYSAVKDFRNAFQHLAKHNAMKDSFSIQESSLMSFEVQRALPSGNGVHNLWLLVMVTLIACLVPVIVFRFKR